jgi:preprotein translocase subunit SecF
MRLRLAPEKTNFDFFRFQWVTFGGSMMLTVLAIVVWAVMGLNYGIDFRGGTTIRTESPVAVDTGAYRTALNALDVGDVLVTEVFDPTFGPEQNVAQVRIGVQEGAEAVSGEIIAAVEAALLEVDPEIRITSVESVGAKVSGELVLKAVLAMTAATGAILVYIWLRFEWQFAAGAVLALVHDIFIVMGIWALFQLRFDLTIIAALLTILGYSINDTVVVFDRLRENLKKYKTMPLREVMNLTVNETLSRTLMTSTTTLIALTAMAIWGGDVMRGFAIAIIIGVVLGTYSSVFVAKNIVLIIGLDRSDKPKKKSDTNEFANIDA